MDISKQKHTVLHSVSVVVEENKLLCYIGENQNSKHRMDSTLRYDVPSFDYRLYFLKLLLLLEPHILLIVSLF